MPSPQVDTPTARGLADRNTVRFGIGEPSVLTATAVVKRLGRTRAGRR